MSDSDVEQEAIEAAEPSAPEAKLSISVSPQSTPVDHLLMQAIDLGASDVHIEPASGHARIRLRKGGILEEHLYEGPPCRGLISIVKIRSHMDSERNGSPQNGVFAFTQNEVRYSIQASTYPCIHGEKAVLHILRSDALMTLGSLGMSDGQVQSVNRLARRPGGLLLVAGPWSSGKTATLYSLATQSSHMESHVITIEDPVEHRLPGISQGQVNVSAGLTYETGMRSILRQDPDVILVGEILEPATGKLVMDACLQAGRRVLSSVHTDTALEAIDWLLGLGLRADGVAHALSGVVVQRLLRKLCDKCKEPKRPGPKLVEQIGFTLDPDTTFYVGKGCEACAHTGYKGKTGCFEVVAITGEMRELIIKKAAPVLMKKALRKQGVETVRRAGIRKAAQGLTSLREVVRVT